MSREYWEHMVRTEPARRRRRRLAAWLMHPPTYLVRLGAILLLAYASVATVLLVVGLIICVVR